MKNKGQVKKNGPGVSGGTSNGQKTKDKEKKIQKINTIYRIVTQENQKKSLGSKVRIEGKKCYNKKQ